MGRALVGTLLAWLGVALLSVTGCRGAVDRVFFDDSADGGLDEGSVDGGTDDDASGGDGGATADGGTDGAADVASDAPKTYAIGGTVVGLNGSGLTLLDNGGDAKVIGSSGQTTTFAFPGRLASGQKYDVTIQTQPTSPTQNCVVAGGTGTVLNGDVTSVVVNCQTNTYTIGGNVSGLEGTLVLQNNAGDDLKLTADGSFAFSVPVASQSTYNVTVLTQPGSPQQNCVVSNGSGKVNNAPVTDVSITCTTYAYTVGGAVSGLTVVGGLVLQDNGGDNLPVPTNGTFTFATPVLSGRNYDVTVYAAPSDKTCKVTNATGTITTAPVTNVAVTCYKKVLLSENFDLATPPALPSGWTSVADCCTGGDGPWVTSTTTPYSSPNDAFGDEASHVTDIHLDTPSFHVDTTTAAVQFEADYQLEAGNPVNGTGYDGVVLEISFNGGAFQDFVTAGGTFTANGYSHTISGLYQSKLAGRQAWSGTSGGGLSPVYVQVSGNLPASAAGTNVVLRWRIGTDKQTFGTVSGYRLDSVLVTN